MRPRTSRPFSAALCCRYTCHPVTPGPEEHYLGFCSHGMQDDVPQSFAFAEVYMKVLHGTGTLSGRYLLWVADIRQVVEVHHHILGCRWLSRASWDGAVVSFHSRLLL